jgi:hypothetical protein
MDIQPEKATKILNNVNNAWEHTGTDTTNNNVNKSVVNIMTKNILAEVKNNESTLYSYLNYLKFQVTGETQRRVELMHKWCLDQLKEQNKFRKVLS